MIRPEAQAQLWRIREVLIALGLAMLGLWWVIMGQSLLQYVGAVTLALAMLLLFAGIQRARFRSVGGGAGIVRTDEARITYFGPLTGGYISIAELEEIRYDPSGKPAHWVLVEAGSPPLFIPINAEGTEALFNAFTSLSGFQTETMLKMLANPPASSAIVWQADPIRLH